MPNAIINETPVRAIAIPQTPLASLQRYYYHYRPPSAALCALHDLRHHAHLVSSYGLHALRHPVHRQIHPCTNSLRHNDNATPPSPLLRLFVTATPQSPFLPTPLTPQVRMR